MTCFAIFPRVVKVLEIRHDPFGYRPLRKRVIGKKLHVGTYYVAEHSKTPGLEVGDLFIIKEHFETSLR